MLGKQPMHRGVRSRNVGRLCVFLLSLSILAVMAPVSAKAQMCVHYARQLTGFAIQGDAWMWWQHSAGRYQHGARPEVGSVLVFRRTGRLQYGHVSVVSRLIDRRTVLVDHSWLEGSSLHRGMKVIDVSPNNSWTMVKVWYEPSDNLGLRAYPTFGFIYPHGGHGGDQALTVAEDDSGAGDDDDIGNRNNGPTAHRPAARTPVAQAPARAASDTQVAAAPILPQRKPSGAVAPTARTAPTPTPAVLVAALPRRKPGVAATAEARPDTVEVSEVPQVVVPRRKPSGNGAQQVADRGGSEMGD